MKIHREKKNLEIRKKYQERISFQPKKKYYWNISEKNSLTIAVNVLYAKKVKTYPAFVSEHNSNCEKQAILLVIPNGEGWHYLAANRDNKEM